MAKLVHTQQVVLIVMFSYILHLVETRCYYPDSSVAKQYVACNSTAGINGSACYDPEDICSTNGLCFGTANFMYRGGCTDKDWNSSNCASLCTQGTIACTLQGRRH